MDCASGEERLDPRIPLNNSFKKALCQVLLSCMIFSADQTLLCLSQPIDGRPQLLPPQALFSQLFSPQHLYLTSYERKLFIFALTNLLFATHSYPFWSSPPSNPNGCSLLAFLGPQALDGVARVMEEIICMLLRHQRIEHKERKRAEAKGAAGVGAGEKRGA